ncbi:signal peptidase I [Terricaulis sp.]|uniref:signal peptidase I n=1 Tax=Terricaulis sp. TaxID=2768686 RepID=UPI002AC72378|nr:signal peptidase I [Terricaulis sp.]MDZ4691962.1 signal peptidase I [Terricaulis sp.]
MSEEPKRKRGAPWFIWTLPALIILALTLNHIFVFQLFRQPSGSMQPTLQAGKMFALSKWAYGYTAQSFGPLGVYLPEREWSVRTPERGDIVVFEPVPEPGRHFVKRVIGLPGDRIQMIGGVVHINGAAVQREPEGELQVEDYSGPQTFAAVRETLPNGVSYLTVERGETELDNTRELFVPEGHAFVMGDDRDNSADSRVPSVVGFVPVENVLGRVDHRF